MIHQCSYATPSWPSWHMPGHWSRHFHNPRFPHGGSAGCHPPAALPYLPRCEFMWRIVGKCHSHSARNDCYHVPLYLRSVLSVAIRSWECGQKAPVLLFAALQWWWIGASKTTIMNLIMNLTLIPPFHHGHVGRLQDFSPFQSRARWHKDPVNEPSSWTSHGSSVGQSECTNFFKAKLDELIYWVKHFILGPKKRALPCMAW